MLPARKKGGIRVEGNLPGNTSPSEMYIHTGLSDYRNRFYFGSGIDEGFTRFEANINLQSMSSEPSPCFSTYTGLVPTHTPMLQKKNENVGLIAS